MNALSISALTEPQELELTSVEGSSYFLRTKSAVLKTLKTCAPKNEPTPTVGLEIEFFLFTADGKGASFEASTAFLKEASSNPLAVSYSMSNGEIGAIHLVTGDRQPCATLKYEYAPHLLELAFTPCEDLFQLHSLIDQAFDVVYSASQRVGLEILLSSFVELNQIDAKVGPSLDKRLQEITESRRHYLSDCGVTSKEIIYFPSYTAGCQVHVGGVAWYRRPEAIIALYSNELRFRLMAQSCFQDARVYDMRDHLYRSAFPTMILVGQPFATWSLDSWIAALHLSPMTRQFRGKPYTTLKALYSAHPEIDLDATLPLCRDLQIFRPRLFGTIECRSDGVPKNIEFLKTLVTLRFAYFLSCLTFDSKSESPISEVTLKNSLKARGRREEQLLPK